MSKLMISLLLLMFLGGCGQKGALYEEKAPSKNQTQTSSPAVSENKEAN